MKWNDSSLKVALVACLAGLAAVFCFLWVSGPFQFPYDDSYIALEFARNLAAIGRVSYDGVHTTPGATTLLHILLLSVPARLGLPMEFSSVTVGILFFVLLIQRVAALARYLTQSWDASLYAALATALTGYLVYDAVSGMETTFFMFLTVACVGSLIKACDERKGFIWPAAWLYCTALARPEGLWLAVSLMLYVAVLALRERQEIRRFAMLAGHLAGAVLLVLLTQWLLTGNVTPHTALAKVYLFNQFRLPFHVKSFMYRQRIAVIWGPLLLALLPALWTRRARRLLWSILPWILITQVMFLLLLPNEVVTYHGRYFHPLMPFAFILAGDGLSVLLHLEGQYRIPRWGLAICFAWLVGIFYLNLVALQGGYIDDKACIRNNNIWSVEWLQANAPPGIRVATHDIGALRYLGRYELVDVSGLIDEEAMARNHAERGQFAYLASRRPDYLVADVWWMKHMLHYYPAIDCCATEVAAAHTNALTAVQLRIFRMDWNQLGKTPSATAGDPLKTASPVSK